MITLQRTSPFRVAIPWPARPSARLRSVLALIGANAIWGGSAVATKAALGQIPPLMLACLRVAIAYLVLRTVLAVVGRTPATGRGPALLGVTGVALFCASQNLGLIHGSAATTALINGTIPLLTALLAVAHLGERMGWRQIGGLMIAFTGILLIVLDSPGGASGNKLLGTLLPLISAASFAAYAVLGRRLFAGGDALALVGGGTRYGLIALAPFALGEAALGDGIGDATARDLVLLLFLGAGCSAVAFLLAGYGMGRLEASHAAAFGNLKPLIGVGLAVALLGEALSDGQFGGGLLVLAGVVVAELSGTRRVLWVSEGPPSWLYTRGLSTVDGRFRAVHRSRDPWAWTHNQLLDLSLAPLRCRSTCDWRHRRKRRFTES